MSTPRPPYQGGRGFAGCPAHPRRRARVFNGSQRFVWSACAFGLVLLLACLRACMHACMQPCLLAFLLACLLAELLDCLSGCCFVCSPSPRPLVIIHSPGGHGRIPSLCDPPGPQSRRPWKSSQGQCLCHFCTTVLGFERLRVCGGVDFSHELRLRVRGDIRVLGAAPAITPPALKKHP